MKNRKYIRRIRSSYLRAGYIPEAVFKGVTPSKIFVCIWSSDPNEHGRAKMTIRPREVPVKRSRFLKDFPQAGNYELVLHTEKQFPQDQYVIKFDKTADVFDNQGFFWTAVKGHNFQIETESIESSGLVFEPNSRNKNRYFLEMLQVLGADTEISICDYLSQNFDVVSKNTYSFAIYLQVKFYKDCITFQDSTENIYRIKDVATLLDENLKISSVLYEYTVAIQNKSQGLQAKDPKNLERFQEDTKSNAQDKTIQLDVRQVLKECLQDFIASKDPKQITDEDYLVLVDDLLENLAKITYDTSSE